MLYEVITNAKLDFGRAESGARVSNTWLTCPSAGDNHWKRWRSNPASGTTHHLRGPPPTERSSPFQEERPLSPTQLPESQIDGVEVTPLTYHQDGRGWLAEIYREDELSVRPVMAYVSQTHPGVV